MRSSHSSRCSSQPASSSRAPTAGTLRSSPATQPPQMRWSLGRRRQVADIPAQLDSSPSPGSSAEGSSRRGKQKMQAATGSPVTAPEPALLGSDARTPEAAGGTGSALWEITDELVKSLITGYVSQPNEYEYWMPDSCVEGEIPQDLDGTLFRNGPGLIEVFGKRLNQPFDGDGMICQLAFRDGKLHFRNKYVRTEGFVKEQEAGRMLFKGAFSSGNPSGGWFYNPFNFSVKNVANTGVLHWAGKLWALHESGLPYEMDPRSLDTVGESHGPGGTIEGNGPLAAHYRVTTEADGSKRWCSFGSAVAGTDANITFYEYGQDGSVLHQTPTKIKGAAFGFFHDMAITEHYYILFQNPTRLDAKKLLTEYMFAKCSIAECITFDTKLNMRIHLIPRPGRPQSDVKRTQQVFETAPFFSFHHCNACEHGRYITVDTVAWDQLSFTGFNVDSLSAAYYKGGQRSELHRVVINTASGEVTRQSLSHRCCEFPTIPASRNGKQAKYLYAPAAAVEDVFNWGPNQVLMKMTLPEPSPLPVDPATIKTELWGPGRTKFTMEPMFVPRRDATAEDDGYILMLLHNGETGGTEFAILDAQRISEGPVCLVKLPHHIPIGLHGCWSDEYFGPAVPAREEYPRDWAPKFSTVGH